MTKVKVRKATQADAPWLLAQISAFERFAGFKYPLITGNAEAPAILAGVIATHVVLIAVADGARVGFIAGYIAAHPLCPTLRVLSELFWWVVPSARGSSAGARLLVAFEEIGRAACDWVVVSLETVSPVRGASLQRRGFRHVESAYLLEV